MIDQATIDAIAEAVAEKLRDGDHLPRPRLLTVEQVADRYGVSKDCVYRNAAKWGGVKLGDGPKARWRFDVDRLAVALAPRPDAPRPPAASRGRRSRAASAAGPVDLLPIRGRRP